MPPLVRNLFILLLTVLLTPISRYVRCIRVCRFSYEISNFRTIYWDQFFHFNVCIFTTGSLLGQPTLDSIFIAALTSFYVQYELFQYMSSSEDSKVTVYVFLAKTGDKFQVNTPQSRIQNQGVQYRVLSHCSIISTLLPEHGKDLKLSTEVKGCGKLRTCAQLIKLTDNLWND